MSNVYKSEEVNFDNLLLTGQVDVVTDIVTVAAEQNLKRGCVVGLNSETKLAYPVDKTKTDGTEEPYAVLAEDADATGSDPVFAAAYLNAELNVAELVVINGTVDDYKQKMRNVGLIVRDAQRRY